MAISDDNEQCRQIADDLLNRHNHHDPEANITSSIRDFLIQTQLVTASEIGEESAPAIGSQNSVDLATRDTYIQVKRRIGNQIEPHAENVKQLDGYLQQAMDANRGVRMGILTDGKYWVLRWPGGGDVNTAAPYSFTLSNPDRWYLL